MKRSARICLLVLIASGAPFLFWKVYEEYFANRSPDSIWKDAKESYQKRKIRWSLDLDNLLKTTDPAKLAEAIDKLTDSERFQYSHAYWDAIQGIFFRWGEIDPIGAIAYLEHNKRQYAVRDATDMALVGLLDGWGSANPEDSRDYWLKDSHTLHLICRSNYNSDSLILVLLESWATHHPHKTCDWHLYFPEEIQHYVLTLYLFSLSEKHPEDMKFALDKVDAVTWEKKRAGDPKKYSLYNIPSKTLFGISVATWAKTNPEEAFQWIADLPDEVKKDYLLWAIQSIRYEQKEKNDPTLFHDLLQKFSSDEKKLFPNDSTP